MPIPKKSCTNIGKRSIPKNETNNKIDKKFSMSIYLIISISNSNFYS